MYTSRTISAPFSFFFDSISPLAWFFLRRASFCPIILLTWWGISFEGGGRGERMLTAPNLRVFFATPILSIRCQLSEWAFEVVQIELWLSLSSALRLNNLISKSRNL